MLTIHNFKTLKMKNIILNYIWNYLTDLDLSFEKSVFLNSPEDSVNMISTLIKEGLNINCKIIVNKGYHLTTPSLNFEVTLSEVFTFTHCRGIIGDDFDDFITIFKK